MYRTKHKAIAECSGLGGVIEPSVITMPGTDFANATDKTTADCLMFMSIRKAGVLFMLCQESSHGLAMFQNTVSMRNPHGKIINVLVRMGD